MSMTPKLLTIAGQTMSMKEWSRQPGAAPYHTIVNRLIHGWPHEPAVFTPSRPRGGKGSRVRLVGVNRPSRASHVPPKRPALILAPNPRVPNPHPPTWGGFSSWPIEALEMLRRCA